MLAEYKFSDQYNNKFPQTIHFNFSDRKMVIELITSITLLQTSFSLHRANPSEGADTSFQTSEPGRAYKHRVVWSVMGMGSKKGVSIYK